MSNYEATRYDFDAANITGIEGIPTATIVPWSTASVPSGFLECNGQAVSRSTYATLFGIVGTTYGSGDGSTTFNVPDLQDNVPVGKSGTKNVGSTGGANTFGVTASGNIAGSTANATLSTAQLASHSHSAPTSPAGQLSNANSDRPFRAVNPGGNTGSAGSGSGHSHNMSANFAGNTVNASTLQPYLTVMYIIKT
jgi:microcystin-dependent protein